jgi:hypothetical protein
LGPPRRPARTHQQHAAARAPPPAAMRACPPRRPRAGFNALPAHIARAVQRSRSRASSPRGSCVRQAAAAAARAPRVARDSTALVARRRRSRARAPRGRTVSGGPPLSARARRAVLAAFARAGLRLQRPAAWGTMVLFRASRPAPALGCAQGLQVATAPHPGVSLASAVTALYDTKYRQT